MTPQERDVLMPLLARLQQTPVPAKDAEAAQLIQQAQAAQPDMAYILAQTVLMQDYALHAAQARIQELEQRQSSSSGSFLGGLFGGGRPQQSPAPAQGGPWGAPQSPYAQPMASAMQGNAPPSFLRSAAQTAIGVAGGSLLFQGIESLFGGRGGFGGGYGMGMGGGNTEIVNNYFDAPAANDAGANQNMSDADFSNDNSGGDFSGDDGSFDV